MKQFLDKWVFLSLGWKTWLMCYLGVLTIEEVAWVAGVRNTFLQLGLCFVLWMILLVYLKPIRRG